jgi:hypothetical protein
MNRKSVIAFACNDDLGKASSMESWSQRWGDKPGVHGQGNLREINTLMSKCSFQTRQHENEQICFGGIVASLFWAKQ